MPQLYRRSVRQSEGIYHVFNRGVNKTLIFLDTADYATYRRFLKEYLQPKERTITEILGSKFPMQLKMYHISKIYSIKNYSENLQLLSFCLMPNHIHLLVRQKESGDLAKFIHSLHTRYAMYFNRKHKREGTLFQSKYRSKLVSTDRYLIEVSKYIHSNPIALCSKLENYAWSSLAYYHKETAPEWLHTDLILSKYIISPVAKVYKSYSDYVKVRP